MKSNVQAETAAGEPLFSNHALMMLMVPLIVEQLLNSLMGTADTMMVSNVGSAAISAASLVDSINNLVMQVFTAMSVGGTVVCSQYLGRGDKAKARESARQVILSTLVVALAFTAVCVGARGALLRLIFGQVEAEVMENAMVYFLYTGLSYPFIAMYNSAAAVYRSEGHSRLPMAVSMTSNALNIAGNAILIFVCHMGIAGAALATLGSRVFSAFLMMMFLRGGNRVMVVRDYGSIRPNFAMIAAILTIGVPNGIENGMFQFGKLAIQSTLSTLGTISMAAQAMAQILEYVSSMAGIGIGLALVTVVGQCIGAGRQDEARMYIRKMTRYAEFTVIASGLILSLSVRGITSLAGMEAESARLCCQITWLCSFVKCFVWARAFVPAYGMRSAGDVKFAMIISMSVMWLCRVVITVVLVRVFHFGIIAMWIGMFCDWTVRAFVFHLRCRSGKWLNHHVIRD